MVLEVEQSKREREDKENDRGYEEGVIEGSNTNTHTHTNTNTKGVKGLLVWVEENLYIYIQEMVCAPTKQTKE